MVQIEKSCSLKCIENRGPRQDLFIRPDLAYRYFSVAEVRQALGLSRRPVLALVDGPFQEMVNQMGLMAVFTAWGRERKRVVHTYEALSRKVGRLMAERL